MLPFMVPVMGSGTIAAITCYDKSCNLNDDKLTKKGKFFNTCHISLDNL